jgi:hypothetical protein
MEILYINRFNGSMKFIFTILALVSISISASAAEDIHVIDNNGDAEIYIPKEGEPNTYIASGIIAEPQDKPTLRVYTSDSMVRVPANGVVPTTSDVHTATTVEQPAYTTVPVTPVVPTTVTMGYYVPLVDEGGKYDAPDDVYRPDVEFPQ